MGDITEKTPLLSDLKSDENTNEEENDTLNEKEKKPSICKLKLQSFTDLSVVEWIFITVSLLAVAVAEALSILMFIKDKNDSVNYIFAIVLVITSVFLLVYTAHGVFWRMSYSILLHGLCSVVLMAYCIVYYILPKDKEPMRNRNQTLKITILIIGAIVGVANVLLVPYLFRKYWKARVMTCPLGSRTNHQDEKVKQLFAKCLLLLDLQLELTFTAFVLKIDQTGLGTFEISNLVFGFISSFGMCGLGFWFLHKKCKPLVCFIILASLAEAGYTTYYLISDIMTWMDISEVIHDFILAVATASLAVTAFVLAFLIDIYNGSNPCPQCRRGFSLKKYTFASTDNETTTLLSPQLEERRPSC